MSNLLINAPSEILAAIRQSLVDADKATGYWSQREPERSEIEAAEYYMEQAFIQTRIFLEAAGLLKNLTVFQQLEKTAKSNFAMTAYSDEISDIYLVWAGKLRHYLSAIEDTFGDRKAGTIIKDVIQILRETQYSITDTHCFPSPPQTENDVHVRIEAVLRCVFPDLMHKPTIAKQIKHFEPDTGLPSIRTLIEYKFISNAADAKRVCDEVLADTRGYVSKDWDQFIYVIYETKRIKPEKQWKQLLEMSGVSTSTGILVLHGEDPGNFAKKKAEKVPNKQKLRLQTAKADSNF